eukprot:2547919-Pleurochrysis_carterae.AAC.1
MTLSASVEMSTLRRSDTGPSSSYDISPRREVGCEALVQGSRSVARVEGEAIVDIAAQHETVAVRPGRFCASA